MKYVRLQYIGKKPSLHLTMARLKAEYTFEKGNEMTAPVEYDDAAYLLRTNMAIFKVVGGPFESEPQLTLKSQEEQSVPVPIVTSKDPNEERVTEGDVSERLAWQGASMEAQIQAHLWAEEPTLQPGDDGVEGTGPMPDVLEKREPERETEKQKPAKKGKK